MIDGGALAESRGELNSGRQRATLLSRLHEPAGRHDRFALVARAVTVAAGLAVLAVLFFDLYTESLGGSRGFRVTVWGGLTKFGVGFDVDYRPPVYGYGLAVSAAVVILTAWAYPRCASLALAVLAGCAFVLYVDVQSLGGQAGQHVVMGPLLPVVAGAVALACLVRLADWARRQGPQA
jgi:hypothetical protein